MSHSVSFDNDDNGAATFGGPGEYSIEDTPAVDRPRGAAIRHLDAAQVDARVPAVQTRLLRSVIGATLKRVGSSLYGYRIKAKGDRKSMNSESSQLSMWQGRWPGDGEADDEEGDGGGSGGGEKSAIGAFDAIYLIRDDRASSPPTPRPSDRNPGTSFHGLDGHLTETRRTRSVI